MKGCKSQKAQRGTVKAEDAQRPKPKKYGAFQHVHKGHRQQHCRRVGQDHGHRQQAASNQRSEPLLSEPQSLPNQQEIPKKKTWLETPASKPPRGKWVQQPLWLYIPVQPLGPWIHSLELAENMANLGRGSVLCVEHGKPCDGDSKPLRWTP